MSDDSSAHSSARGSARLFTVLVPMLAVALMVLGVLLGLAGTGLVGTGLAGTGLAGTGLAGTGPASFGWFAYAPLSDATFLPMGGVTVLGPGGAAGIVVVILGLVLLAFWSGYRTARRPRTARIARATGHGSGHDTGDTRF